MFAPFRRRGAAPVAVTLYERPGCHLCQDAARLLRRLSRRYPMLLHTVDITSDPDLVRKYDLLIPVIVIGTDTELSAPIDEGMLRRALDSAIRAGR